MKPIPMEYVQKNLRVCDDSMWSQVILICVQKNLRVYVYPYEAGLGVPYEPRLVGCAGNVAYEPRLVEHVSQYGTKQPWNREGGRGKYL